jgi:1-deoxy-D-xylulose-5-phosphate synthase
VFEAMNNAGGLKKNFLVILNDNEMSICPRVGALAQTLDRARLSDFYRGSKRAARASALAYSHSR